MHSTGSWIRVTSLAAIVSIATLTFVLTGAAGEAVAGSSASFSGSLLGNPLVVPSSEVFVGGQQAAAQVSRRANPLAVLARQRSRFAYSSLSPSRVDGLLDHSFPSVIGQPSGGAPRPPAGTRVVGYPSTHAEQLALPNHQLGILESAQPLARRAGHGRYQPIDLALEANGAGYAPAVPAVPVSIPHQISSGISVGGVSLTPVDAGGHKPSSRGVLNQAAVVYPMTGPSTDTIAKPTLDGFQLDAALRSAASPQRLYFRVGAPQGARLAQDGETGAIRITSGGKALATIMPPGAEDSAETAVPASMHLAGHTLVVVVAHRSGSYLYPIEVDPEVNDSQLAETTSHKRSNWEFHTSNLGRFEGKAIYEAAGKEHLETKGIAPYEATEWAYWGYETKGNSKIYELKTKTSAKNKGSKIESFLEFEASGGTEKPKKLLSTEGSEPEYSEKATTICAWNASKVEECLPAAGKEKNAVHFQQSATASPGGSFGFFDTMSEGIVSISEPSGTHSTTSYNTTSPELEFMIEGKLVKRKNGLYGSSNWLSNVGGALQLNSADPGIGVATTRLEYESSTEVWTELSRHEYLEKENACQGVQCYASHSEYWTLDPKLPDGERKIRYRGEEAIAGTQSLASEGQATVKVDSTKPHRLFLQGLPYGEELSERPYELTAEATDGEGSTVASSGVKSLSLYVDGSQFGTSGGSCSVAHGECTATDKWTINGAELGAGHHAIVLVVFDNAGNEARLERTISIHHSTPVALGPGSVDLQSGDFALGATDVSMGSGLTVGRTYSSRDLMRGKEGSLGLQWNISLSSTESLREMVDGGMLLTDAKGGQSIFAPIGGGKFEAPTGDANLSLTLEENEAKQKLAYYLTDAAKHTSVKFTQPAPGTAWLPTKQEGSVATDTVTYKYQGAEQYTEYAIGGESDAEGIVAGPDGNMWYATGYRGVGKMTPYGVYTEYAFPAGSYALNITVGPDNNMWVTEWGTSKIGKITTAGAITEYALPANSTPEQIVTGPDGNLWFTEYETNKIGKITTSGTVTEYSLPAGSHPFAIGKGPDGNLWFSENGTGKIAKITTAGTITEFSKMSGTEPRSYGIVAGPDGNVWFTKYCLGCAKVVKMTTSGTMTEYALGAGASPRGIVVGSDKNLWTVSDVTNKVIKVTTEGAIKEFSVPTKYPESIAPGPEGNLWYAEQLDQIGVIPTSGVTVEPLEALAPKPSGVSCEPELKAGCRALKFKYATETTTTGEASSEWGQFRSRLSQVSLDAYNPVTKAMQETAVAEYSYDKLGRLRAEWDPRISPALKTTYGYDQEGHVTALTPPGEESWAFTYGSIVNDKGTGRLLKVARAPASAGLWGGELVKNTAEPVITGSATVGVKDGVTDGTWTGSPVLYSYQWEDCNSSGLECTPIAGASNANYSPTATDVGHKLVALVTATNGGGSVTVASKAGSTVVGSFVRSSLGAESLNAVTCFAGSTDCVVSDSAGNAYYSTNVSTSTTATWTKWNGPGVSPSEALACTSTMVCLMADGNKSGAGSLYYATSLGGSWTLAVNPSYGVDAISCASASLCVEGQDSGGYFRYSTNPASTSWTLESQGSAAMTGVSCFSTALCAIVDSAGSVHAATTAEQIESSSWISTNVDGTTRLTGIACRSTINCWAVDNAGNVLKLAVASGGAVTSTKTNIDGTNAFTGISCGGPEGICAAVDDHGNVFRSNSGEPWVQIYTPGGKLTSVGCAWSNLCVAGDTEGNVTALNQSAKVTAGETRTPQLGFTLEYGVPLAGGSGLPSMTENEVAKWGQEDAPVEGTAIVAPDSRQGWPATDYSRATAYYLDEKGQLVNQSNPSVAPYGSVSTTEHNELNDVVRTLSADNRQKALEAGVESVSVAKLLATYYTYKSECSKPSESKEEAESQAEGGRLCEVEGPQHTIKYTEGKEHKEALGRLHTKYFYDEKAPGGKSYNLKTREVTIAELSNEAKEEVEGRVTKYSYSGQSGLGWELRAPTSVTVDPEGKKLTTTTFYNATTGKVTETRAPLGAAGGSAHDEKIIYYSAEANTEGYSSCGSHPEWAGLVCEALPAKQPEAGTPALPVIATTYYNIWNEPTTVTETFGSTTRTKSMTYDVAGRLATSETTAPANAALPMVTDEYNATTGKLEKQSTTVEAKTKTLTSKYNKLGQLIEYTDADGNTAKYTYGGPENDWLLEELADGSDEGTGRQVYSYNATTKQIETLWDSAAGTFTASYDAEGKMTSEVYPNAMCANATYNSVGEATHIEYIKTSKCSETGAPVWYSESLGMSVRGTTFDRASTLANESYFYDTAERLTEAQETPTEGGCSVRLYAYDEESNRTSQTSRVPGTGGKCATEGGSVLTHSYDEGNRLKDSGVTYDVFGNATKLPTADAEGHELTSTFYVDNAVATQSQNGVTHNYYLDPEGRVREMVTGATTTVNHYDGLGPAVTWTSEGSGKGTRNIPGIDGTLSAIQTNGEAPVLQLHDLQGDVIATASLSTEATKVLSSYNSTEFGVPNAEKAPPKFAWLGAQDVASAFSSGVITYGSTSYVPQTGRALQSEQVVPPGLPNGSGAGAPFISPIEAWNDQGAEREAAEAPGLEAAREQEAFEASMVAVDPYVVYPRDLAWTVGDIYLKEKTLGEILNLFDIPDDLFKLAEKFIVDKLGLDVAFAWLHDAGEKLKKCSDNKISVTFKKQQYADGACLFSYGTLEFSLGPLSFTIFDFWQEPWVWDCAYVPDHSVGEGGRVCNHEVAIPKEL